MRSFLVAATLAVLASANDPDDFWQNWYANHECSGTSASSASADSQDNCFAYCLGEDGGEGGCCYFQKGKSTCYWFPNSNSWTIEDASADGKRVRYIQAADAMCSGTSGLTITETADTKTFSSLGCSSAVMFDYSSYDDAPGGPYPAMAQDYSLEIDLTKYYANNDYKDSDLSFVSSISDLGSTIGLTLDGVVILSPATSETDDDAQTQRVYDSCNAHADGSNRYHYHGYPLCLGRDMGATVPDESDWTIFTKPSYDGDHDTANMTAYVEKWISKWPATGTATLMGYMRDGLPIYSPYDENGNLIKYGSLFDGSDTVTYFKDTYSGVSDWVSTLDVCNGYYTSSGEYRYVFTPSPPWTVSCYRRKKFTINYDSSTSNCQCPDDGLCADGTTTHGTNSCSDGSAFRVSSSSEEGGKKKMDAKLKRIENLQRMTPRSTCATTKDCRPNEVCQCVTQMPTRRRLLFGGAASGVKKCSCKYLD